MSLCYATQVTGQNPRFLNPNQVTSTVRRKFKGGIVSRSSSAYINLKYAETVIRLLSSTSASFIHSASSKERSGTNLDAEPTISTTIGNRVPGDCGDVCFPSVTYVRVGRGLIEIQDLWLSWRMSCILSLSGRTKTPFARKGWYG